MEDDLENQKVQLSRVREFLKSQGISDIQGLLTN